MARHHVDRELTYLTGSLAQLRPVWKHYYVGSDAQEVNRDAVADRSSPDLVTHTAVVYVVDPRGRMRLLLDADFAPRDLVTDLRLFASGAVR